MFNFLTLLSLFAALGLAILVTELSSLCARGFIGLQVFSLCPRLFDSSLENGEHTGDDEHSIKLPGAVQDLNHSMVSLLTYRKHATSDRPSAVRAEHSKSASFAQPSCLTITNWHPPQLCKKATKIKSVIKEFTEKCDSLVLVWEKEKKKIDFRVGRGLERKCCGLSFVSESKSPYSGFKQARGSPSEE